MADIQNLELSYQGTRRGTVTLRTRFDIVESEFEQSLTNISWKTQLWFYAVDPGALKVIRVTDPQHLHPSSNPQVIDTLFSRSELDEDQQFFFWGNDIDEIQVEVRTFPIAHGLQADSATSNVLSREF